MSLPWAPAELTNWSKSARSKCLVCTVGDTIGIARALEIAQTQNLSIIPHGAGHSYTDAALNTGGVVIDLRPMHRILSWDAAHGIMRVEAGVTLREMVQTAWKDGWWPAVSPSTPEVTVGGCAAMNVNGRNAWKCGPFGAAIVSMDVMNISGETHTFTPELDPQLFNAFVGSLGLLGIITSITLQLQRITSGYVNVRRRSAASIAEIFRLFNEAEHQSDFMEAWLDGFASGRQLGRGNLTSATLDTTNRSTQTPFSQPGPLVTSLVKIAAGLGRSALMPGMHIANHANFWQGKWGDETAVHQQDLISYTFWPLTAFAGYHVMFPDGVETFQAFISAPAAQDIFTQVLRYSQQKGCIPIWCILKRHQRDPFLLSYQVDGFSLELNYSRSRQTAQKLQQVLQDMIAMVIEAGGQFYLAKDHFLTRDQYRQSVGGEVVDAFLGLKRRFDPESRLQSDLYRRIFQPG